MVALLFLHAERTGGEAVRLLDPLNAANYYIAHG